MQGNAAARQRAPQPYCELFEARPPAFDDAAPPAVLDFREPLFDEPRKFFRKSRRPDFVEHRFLGKARVSLADGRAHFLRRALRIAAHLRVKLRFVRARPVIRRVPSQLVQQRVHARVFRDEHFARARVIRPVNFAAAVQRFFVVDFYDAKFILGKVILREQW